MMSMNRDAACGLRASDLVETARRADAAADKMREDMDRPYPRWIDAERDAYDALRQLSRYASRVSIMLEFDANA